MIRNVARTLAVSWILLKYGMLGLLDRLRLRKLWYKLSGRSDEYVRLTRPVWMRLAFEDLGPTYIKLAQLVASSEGLFPKVYSEEFRKCLDRVPPFDFSDVETILHEEFGRPYTEVFASLDPVPVAAASIAQVHFATLQDGTEVVVKIQRPRIRPRVESDVKIMKAIAKTVEAIIPHMELANPVGVVEDFELTIFEELDFQLEATNMEQFNEIMRHIEAETGVAPNVYHDYTTERVLTMERFKGWRVDDTEEILAGPYDAEEKLVNGLRAWFLSVTLHGFFHGDVHAGNLMLLDDGRIGFLDFGIIGRFNERQKGMMIEYFLAFQTGDFRKLARVLTEMGTIDTEKLDLDAFANDLKQAYAPLLTLNYGELNFRELLPDILRVSVKHRMRLPREFVLITKQLLYFDRYAKALAPKLNIFSDPRILGFVTEANAVRERLKKNGTRIKDYIADRRPPEAAATTEA